MKTFKIAAVIFSATAVALSLPACSGGGGSASASTSTGANSPITDPSSPTGGPIVVVASGVPSQKFMTLVADKYNLNWDLIGDKAKVTVYVADTAGNPVPDGTKIQFSASAGQIQQYCLLTGNTSTGTNISSCSVDYVVQSPLNAPAGTGKAQIIAWLQGQEAFTDLNGNGQYDANEPYYDSGIPYRDDNQNGIYDAGVDQLVIPSSVAAGTATCNSNSVVISYLPSSIPNTCDGKWGNGYVSAQITQAQTNAGVAVDVISGTVASSAQVTTYSFAGGNKVGIPGGSKISATTVDSAAGCTLTVFPDVIPTNIITPFTHSVRAQDYTKCKGQAIDLKIDVPGSFSSIFTRILFN
jgi:hypothetical protein